MSVSCDQNDTINSVLLESGLVLPVRQFPSNGTNRIKSPQSRVPSEPCSYVDKIGFDSPFTSSSQERTAEEVISGAHSNSCFHFEKQGTCRDGAKCRFRHDISSDTSAIIDFEDNDLENVPEGTFDVQVCRVCSPSTFYLK